MIAFVFFQWITGTGNKKQKGKMQDWGLDQFGVLFFPEWPHNSDIL